MSDPTAKLRNAQIAAAKAISILTKMEVQGYAGERLRDPQAQERKGETTLKRELFFFEGGGALGAERKIVPKRYFSWEMPRQQKG